MLFLPPLAFLGHLCCYAYGISIMRLQAIASLDSLEIKTMFKGRKSGIRSTSIGMGLWPQQPRISTWRGLRSSSNNTALTTSTR
ncbi:Uncharacterized protein HZ326_28584 [Fusarium oxysporum f. sp. albedinis]|nr:60S acidic ribosomal protein P2 [Fusarium oxysporum f. sp. albedinis]KAJ0127808.1 hypothetical protein HZ326_29092 [Fusarium oxysporum f. sp. albedinis]KAJ0127946.1 Uncharacterized protein HZ326_28958 [Fusarium oxysporum f. sp. albedinis]KAJ0128315.1 Uncharacterized protein HZ326_28584 [Fusarium oxysporum f. sp. albedinis]